MFPKKQRIVKKKEIEKVLKTPFRTGFDFGQILLLPRKNIKILQKDNLIEQKINTKTNEKFAEKIQNYSQNYSQNLPLNSDLQNSKLSKKVENKTEINSQTQSKVSNSNLEINNKIDQNKILKIAKNNKEEIQNTIPKIAKTPKVCTKFRVLCIVSKKIHKKANQRNKIRRRFIAVFQDLDSQNRLPPNLDLTIIIRTKDILTAKFQDYQKIIPKVAQFYKKLKFQGKV